MDIPTKKTFSPYIYIIIFRQVFLSNYINLSEVKQQVQQHSSSKVINYMICYCLLVVLLANVSHLQSAFKTKYYVLFYI